jgi:hypothetical protein
MSILLRKLCSRIRCLEKRFVPKKSSPLSIYSEKQLDRARAYRVLVHAEIEYYFEEISSEIASKAFEKWIKFNKPSVTLVHLISNATGNLCGLPKDIGTNITTNNLIQKFYGQYRHAIKNNHGIKTANLLSLLLPLGILESDIDQDWLLTLDGFGIKRGKAAHSSAINYEINPEDDLATVKIIIDGLKKIDIALSDILNSLK